MQACCKIHDTICLKKAISMKKISVFVVLILSTSLFADLRTCSTLVKKNNNLMQNILQLQKAQQISIAKLKANLFQLNLIEMRTQCKDLSKKAQHEADLTLKSFNKVEALFVETGYLKSSSI